MLTYVAWTDGEQAGVYIFDLRGGIKFPWGPSGLCCAEWLRYPSENRVTHLFPIWYAKKKLSRQKFLLYEQARDEGDVN